MGLPVCNGDNDDCGIRGLVSNQYSRTLVHFISPLGVNACIFSLHWYSHESDQRYIQRRPGASQSPCRALQVHELAHVATRYEIVAPKVYWAANERFEILKFKFKFPRARTFELFRARSRLYRSQMLQINTRWKALAEIYTIHSFAPFSSQFFRQKFASFCHFSQICQN